MKIVNRPPAKKARNTTIYTIKNGEVVETTLYDHVMQFVEFITTRYGSRPAMSIAGRIGDFYIQKKTGKIIPEYDYEFLEEEEQREYRHSHKDVIEWQVCHWINEQKFHTIESFDKEQDASNFIYDYIYECEFRDKKRGTRYWYTREEAEQALTQREVQ